MDKSKAKQWLEEIVFDINSLYEDAFTRKDMDGFRNRKNEIIVQINEATACIESIVESE